MRILHDSITFYAVVMLVDMNINNLTISECEEQKPACDHVYIGETGRTLKIYKRRFKNGHCID